MAVTKLAETEVIARSDSVPGLAALLGRLKLGSLRGPAGLTAYPGRNDVWAGITDSGHGIFVKRFTGLPDDTLLRFRRSMAFERLSAAAAAMGLAAPRGLGSDEDARLLVSELLEGARSGADLAADGGFGEDLAHRAGAAVGALHNLPAHLLADAGGSEGTAGGTPAPSPGGPPWRQDSRPVLPSLYLLTGLPVRVFADCSGAELAAWHLMQHDEPLIGAIRDLLSEERRASWVPAHCDLRLDQFLVAGQQLYISDWEEFRLADPARDIGSFAGEWLHSAVLGVAANDAAAAAGEWLSHEEIIRRCAAGIDHAAVTAAAFMAGYRQARPGLDPATVSRATAFAGWHLIDRMMAAARRSARLSAIDRAAAGIGRAIMLAPERSAATVGLAVPS